METNNSHLDNSKVQLKNGTDESTVDSSGLDDLWGSNEKVICGIAVDKNTVTCVQLSVIFTLLLIFGGGVFYAIEHPNEMQRIDDARREYFAERQEIIDILYSTNTAGDLNATFVLYEMLRNHSIGFAEGPNDENQWLFSKAVIFSFTVITTIGYGTFAPSTVAGQMFLIVYALTGIPVAGLSLGFIAERALYVFTVVSQLGKDKALEAFKQFDDDDSGELDEDEFKEAIKMLGFDLTPVEFRKLWSEVDKDGGGSVDLEEFRGAIKLMRADVTEAAGQKNKVYITIIGILLWIAVGVITFRYMEEGWAYSDAIYFVFVSLTTIGLGDFFPETDLGLAFLVVFAMVGLGLVAVLLTLVESIFGEIENARKRKEDEKKRQLENKKKLRHIPTFAGMSDEDIMDLAAKVTNIGYGPNISFIKEGAELDTLFVLTNGSVSISNPSTSRTETISEGCLLLESTILGHATVQQSEFIVRTLEDVELLSFNRSDWEIPTDETESTEQTSETIPSLDGLRIQVENHHRDLGRHLNEDENEHKFANFKINESSFETDRIEIVLS